jgi:multidrug resistance efflux pump
MSAILRLIRFLVTLAAVGLAIFVVVQIWRVYMLAPWTRDGRVFAQNVVVAPEVSGTVVSVPLYDNELVQKGAVLFQIDPQRFQIAIAQAQAQLAAAKLQLQARQADVARRRGLSGLVSKEDMANTGIASAVAAANVDAAQAAVDLAKYDLARATLYAPVTGIVTHLRLQAGDYATAGHPYISLIDTHVHEGDPASIRLMGFPERIQGHVGSIGRGIDNQNDQVNDRGLPVVNPVFDWVRLAQRIPVDVIIDQVPPGVLLASGMTCSVNVGREVPVQKGIAGQIQHWLENNL